MNLRTAILLTDENALLKVHGDTLLEISFYKLREVFDKIFVITSSPEAQAKYSKIIMEDVLCDYSERSHPITQFFTGLKACQCDKVFLAASNMPFLNPKAIKLMGSQEWNRAIVPRYVNGALEPTHAFYKVKPTLQAVAGAINDERYSFEAALLNMDKVNYLPVGELMKVDPQLLTFFKVRSAVDFDTAKAKLNQKVYKGRLAKAQTLKSSVQIECQSETAVYYKVPGTEEEHEVRFDKRKNSWTCDCTYFAMKGSYCSHIIAAKEAQDDI
ncbi:MAG: NTP transferase domain-containing protein [archaeon]